jgi:integrase/recombinase XerD
LTASRKLGTHIMPRGFKLTLPFANWPAEDQNQWEAAFKCGDRFDESGHGAHLAAATRQGLRESYGRFLRFLSANHPDLIILPPEARIDQSLVAEYVSWRKTSCGDVAIAADLGLLRGALTLICPATDWSWLLSITKKIAAMAPREPGKYHLVTSDRLYALGIELMDGAVADTGAARLTRKAQAFQYRDGLIIALLALIPLRRRTLAALRIGRHLIKAGDLWELDIPAADTKTRQPLDYPISNELSARIDLYLERFRGRIPGADKHTGLWPSNLSRPMCPDAIYYAVHRRTKKAFGFGVNLHRFRHAAASFWSSHDPVNVRGVKDLLGQASFATTEKHYIMAQSRLAGRALARALGKSF